MDNNTLESLLDYYGRVVAGRAGPELSMACADHLARALLDYGLESLHTIDEYLLVVHGAQEGIPTIAYANTIMGTAIYLGEVIRRGSPSTEYRWGRTQQSETNEPYSELKMGDLSDLVLLSSTAGTAIAPTEPILRRIRHGSQAPTVHSFAVASIRRAWMAAPT
jgi:hypothetical protein